MSTSKRLWGELFLGVSLSLAWGGIFGNWSAVGLFCLGFIWNWSLRFETQFPPGYRYSMFRLVHIWSDLFLYPMRKWNLPKLKPLLLIFPATVFWYLVIYFNSSLSPWEATFFGSLVYELIELDMTFLKKKADPSHVK